MAAYYVHKGIFRETATTRSVIGGKKFAFDELRKHFSTAKVFRVFGKYIQKLQIAGQDLNDYPANSGYTTFDKFLEVIINCSPNLVELQIDFDSPVISQHTEQLLHRARPFFENITNLNLCIYEATEQFINILPANSARKLKIRRIKSELLNFPAFNRLEQVRVVKITDDNNNLATFFRSHPNLKSLYCLYGPYIDSIRSAAESANHIENIGLLHNLSRRQIESFERFIALKHFRIKIKETGYDLFALLEKLPFKKSLKILSIVWCMGDDSKDESSDESILERLPTFMQNFVNLKWLRLISFYSRSIMFLSTILPQLNAVEKCTFRLTDPDTVLHVIRSVQNRRIIALHLQVFDESLYRQCKEIWEERQKNEEFNDPLVIQLVDYDRAKDSCTIIYNEKIVRLEKNSEDSYFPFCQ